MRYANRLVTGLIVLLAIALAGCADSLAPADPPPPPPADGWHVSAANGWWDINLFQDGRQVAGCQFRQLPPVDTEPAAVEWCALVTGGMMEQL